MSLKEFLREKAEEQRSPAVIAEREEWVSAVDQLLAQLEEWLREADTEGVLKIDVHPLLVRELAIGSYIAHGLKIEFGGQVITITPIARRVLGPRRSDNPEKAEKALGRVDITNGYEKVRLYRYKESDRDVWMIQDEELNFQMRSLTRESFEPVILRMLS